jgi:hypothetical protein
LTILLLLPPPSSAFFTSCLINIGGYSPLILCCYVKWILALMSQIRVVNDAVNIYLVISYRRTN